MDIIAERLAAHWKYKEEIKWFKNFRSISFMVREALENPMPDSSSDFVKDFQLNLYQEEIYVHPKVTSNPSF